MFLDLKYYVFSSDEVKKFDKDRWKNSKDTYNIEIRNHSDDERNRLIRKARMPGIRLND